MKQQIGFLKLHDARVKKVVCDYDQHKIYIPIKLEQKKLELLFEEVMYLKMGLSEPWGAGIYIYKTAIHSDVKEILKQEYDDNMEKMTLYSLLLNSGDKFEIVAKNVKILLQEC